jgi:hypothetical protein
MKQLADYVVAWLAHGRTARSAGLHGPQDNMQLGNHAACRERLLDSAG